MDRDKLYRLKMVCSSAVLVTAIILSSAATATESPPPAAAQPNVFRQRHYHRTPLPTFKDSRNRLPHPVLAGHPEWKQLYWTAWKLAFAHLKQPNPGSGFVSNYIAAAFNGHLFQWDTCFMMMFARYAEPAFHAIGSLDNFYAKQHADGDIVREITTAGKDVYYGGRRNATNPPLFSWAEWQSYQLTKDKSRLATVLPPLAKYYLWLKKNRRRPDGLYWNTHLGSGEDDLKRGPAWAWVGMSAQQAQNAYYLAKIAAEVGDSKTAGYFRDQYQQLVSLINKKMWDPTTGFYYDLKKNGEPTGVKTAIGFWPLLAGVASPQQARALVGHLTNAKEFWRPNVVPVLAADERGYSANGQYWNGAVWAPTNDMIVKGLQRYGYDTLATRVTMRYLNNMAKVLKQTGTIWENYAPGKPAGHGRRNMVGWSGDGPIALLIENVLGIHADAPANSVRWRPRLAGKNGLRHLTVGQAHLSLIASPIRNGKRTLTMVTNRAITVNVNTGIGKPRAYHLRPGRTRVQRPSKANARAHRLRGARPSA